VFLSACNFVEQNLSPAAGAPARRGGGEEAVNFATEITEAKEYWRRTALNYLSINMKLPQANLLLLNKIPKVFHSFGAKEYL